MQVKRLRSKIHQVRVTHANREYRGSITIGKELARAAKLREGDAVLVNSIDKGTTWETYIIMGKEGEVKMNGAAANHFGIGERVHIIQYALYDSTEPYKDNVVHCDDNNMVDYVC